MPLLSLEPFIFPENLLSAPRGDGDPLVRWYVLHTRPRVEKTLARKLLGKQMAFFLPLYQREWRNRGRLFRSYLPLFPGYLFLHGDSQSRTAALETNLVVQALSVDDQAQLAADLARVYHLVLSGKNLAPEDRLTPGSKVEITKGPLAGLEGTILRRGKRLKFFVEVQFLQRAVSAEIESWMLQPCTPSRGSAGEAERRS
jgi:transcriptional antiterminator RfaH